MAALTGPPVAGNVATEYPGVFVLLSEFHEIRLSEHSRLVPYYYTVCVCSVLVTGSKGEQNLGKRKYSGGKFFVQLVNTMTHIQVTSRCGSARTCTELDERYTQFYSSQFFETGNFT
jgi:hypothetical protein